MCTNGFTCKAPSPLARHLLHWTRRSAPLRSGPGRPPPREYPRSTPSMTEEPLVESRVSSSDDMIGNVLSRLSSGEFHEAEAEDETTVEALADDDEEDAPADAA